MEVAWNQVRVSELVSNKEERDRLFAEIRVLKQLKHKNIMTFYDSWLDPKTYCINFITELFTSGTLRQCAPNWHTYYAHDLAIRQLRSPSGTSMHLSDGAWLDYRARGAMSALHVLM